MSTIDLSQISDKQYAFLTADKKHVGFGGARGGGKSWSVRTKAKILAASYDGIKILIVRKTTDSAFIIRKRLKAHVLDDLQILRCVNPGSAVPGIPIDVTGDLFNLLFRDSASAFPGGDSSVDEHMIRVDSALDAHKRLAVSPNSEIDDGFNYGVRKPVGTRSEEHTLNSSH